MSLPSRARFSVTPQGPVTWVRISGSIDERFSPPSLDSDTATHLVIDLGWLRRISSFGVRRWIEFVNRLPRGALGISLVHAPPVMVDQLNMVEGFAGVARVLSVLAPYRCARCAADRLRVVELARSWDPLCRGEAPEQICPVCSEPLQFSDSAREYFDFAVTPSGPPSVDPTVDALLRFRNGGPLEGSSTSKLVEGDVTYFFVSGVLHRDVNVRRLSSGLEGQVVYDLGRVSSVEEGGGQRLAQLVEAAVEGATVFLWRLPDFLVTALGALPPSAPVTLSSLQARSHCVECDSQLQGEVPASELVEALAQKAPLARRCEICGGAASVELSSEVLGALARFRLGPPPPGVELFDQRLLSQYLGAASREPPSAQAGTPQSTPGHHLQILRRIGRGGMAEVFLARQTGVKGFEKYVAVKRVLGQFAQSPELVEMLFAEARNNARLTHPNIVQTFDVGMVEGVAHIIMEYVRGPDVKRLLLGLKKKGIKLPVQHALRIVAETAAGLHFAHSYVDPEGRPHPMVHRDVSPHNVLVSLDGAIKLSDFGIAKVEGEADQTQAGVLKGKVAYVSPEAVAGLPLDARNDVFGLGVVLYELLIGHPPFRRESDAATLSAIAREQAIPPSDLSASIPVEVSRLVLWALEKDPSQRIATAGQFREAIESVMAAHAMRSSPATVAAFFQDVLGDLLSEFGPTFASGTPSPAPAAPVSAREGSASMASVSLVLDDMVLADDSPEAGTEIVINPLGAELPQPAPRPQLRPGVPLTAGPTVTQMPKVRAAPGAKKTRAAARSRLAAPAAAPPPAAPEAPAGKRRALIATVVAAGVALAGVAALGLWLTPGADESQRAVRNLEAGERLYLNGVRVDPHRLRHAGTSPIAAVTRNGRLVRFGTVSAGEQIDARALVAIGPEVIAGALASLEVDTDPAGCTVTVAGEATAALTPVQLSVSAGTEHELEVSCPGQAPWRAWVAGIPGQRIRVAAPSPP